MPLDFLQSTIINIRLQPNLFFKHKIIWLQFERRLLFAPFSTHDTALSLLRPWRRCSNLWQYIHFCHPTVKFWNFKSKNILFAMLLTTIAKTTRHCLCDYAQNHKDVWWSGDKAPPIPSLKHFMEVSGHFHTPAASNLGMFGTYWKFEKVARIVLI